MSVARNNFFPSYYYNDFNYFPPKALNRLTYVHIHNASTIAFYYVSEARNNFYRSPADSKVVLFTV